MPRLLVLLCLAAWTPALARVQTPEGSADTAPPTNDRGASDPAPVSTPPLVDADVDTAEAPTDASDRDPTVRVPMPEPTVGGPPASGRSAGHAVGSGVLEFLGGGIGAAGLGLLGTALLLTADCAGDACGLAAVYLGGGLGVLIGAPVGVILTGALLGREGGIGATVLGYLLGGGVSILGIVGLSSGHGNTDAMVVPLLCLPLLGAVVGYELSHASNTSGAAPPRSLSRGSARWMPVAGVTPRGTFVGGFAGHF